MDIFTTALTKVRPTPIKPDKLRVKSLSKQAATKALSDDVDHVEDHHLYFVKDSQSDQKSAHSNVQAPEADQEQTPPQYVVDEVVEPEILHKQDVLHPKPSQDKNDKDDDEKPHLDIYV
ncbi:hypothetical protein Q4489_12600 [Thalassotalea sp. 1_MG-2023]|uniref:hypothetical protein n=1 Tax=Thalassotalea sp. 1_MG-2023 TaxID=3062680 RepID=UPI0026E369F2|nr:hypothetical protein [Thalassotalea sp. 1_MG-2023]MDO6427860.1 hypothetical protein [Thalassotalea sp. 1_MG-2023]